MPVPVSLVKMNKCLRSGNKSVLAELVTTDVNCPTSITLEGTSGLIIDGQALVVAIKTPEQAKTFGDLCDIFVSTVFRKGTSYARIDVLFDRYRNTPLFYQGWN